VATLEDVRRIAEALPEVTMKTAWGNQMWRVRDKGFVWERALGKKDRADLEKAGVEVPAGETAAVRVPNELAKQELIAAEPAVFFTIPHFDGYPAVLFRLDAIALDELEEIIVDAWLDRAPKRLAQAYLAEHP